VTLLERDRPGSGATRSSFAWLNANDKAPRDYHDLNHAGMRAWAGLSASLGGAAWFPAEGYVLTESLTGHVAEVAARNGATVLTGEPGHVVGLDPVHWAGKVGGGSSRAARAVRTAALAPYRAGRCTAAAGQ
jgi:hypothetical protein